HERRRAHGALDLPARSLAAGVLRHPRRLHPPLGRMGDAARCGGRAHDWPSRPSGDTLVRAPFAEILFFIGPVPISDTMVVSLALSIVLVVVLVALRKSRLADGLSAIYEVLERAVLDMVTVETGWLLPLVLTLWILDRKSTR